MLNSSDHHVLTGPESGKIDCWKGLTEICIVNVSCQRARFTERAHSIESYTGVGEKDLATFRAQSGRNPR